MTNEEAAAVLERLGQHESLSTSEQNACQVGVEALRDTAYLNATGFECAKELFHAWNMWEDENERVTEMEERAKSAEQRIAELEDV